MSREKINWRAISLLGVDVGYSKKKATTGIAIYESGELTGLCRVKSGREARLEVLGSRSSFDAIAIDGPILPATRIEPVYRYAEKRLSSGIFQKRCKPAASHSGHGLIFRQETHPFVEQFAPMARAPTTSSAPFRVFPIRMLVEAFPNSFLGCLISDGCFFDGETAKPRKKFDWLYDHAAREGVFERVFEYLNWPNESLLRQLSVETDHEKRAALICLLTAACAYTGKCLQVGDAADGWITLPPIEIWADWARRAYRGMEAA